MIRAYHFVGEKLRDGRPVPSDGEWLTHEGEAVMCESGLHASRDPFDALQYAPGPVLCLVDCDDVVDEGDDKLVCRRRRIVARFDATDLLRAFARECALDVVHLWYAPQVVVDYLRSGDDSLRDAARAAAWAAAARAAAWAAAALDAAARAAAWAAAARDAAWAAAAWDVARDAARAAARAAATASATVAATDAARAAARIAARAAALDAQRQRFNALVAAKFAEISP